MFSKAMQQPLKHPRKCNELSSFCQMKLFGVKSLVFAFVKMRPKAPTLVCSFQLATIVQSLGIKFTHDFNGFVVGYAYTSYCSSKRYQNKLNIQNNYYH
jgi:hypothetical protein